MSNGPIWWYSVAYLGGRDWAMAPLWQKKFRHRNQRSARAGFCRPGPARPVDLTARPGPARGPELSLGPGPFRPVAWPSPARPGPARPGPTKAVSMGFLETFQYNDKWNTAYLTDLFATYSLSCLFNKFVGYLYVRNWCSPRCEFLYTRNV